MAKRRYYLHTRHDGIFYAELIDPETGQKLPARSTGTKDRDEALLIVAEWLKTGLPSGKKRMPRPLEAVFNLDAIIRSIRKSELDSEGALKVVSILKEKGLIDIPAVKAGNGAVSFIPFLLRFWDHEKSPYVREKLAHGHRIGIRHCYESRLRVQNHWEPAFKGKLLDSITRDDLKEFSLSLTEKGLAPASINKIMAVGTTALSWSFREGKIASDPTQGLINFSGRTKKRGVLTPYEAALVFAADWKDKRAYAANLLACTTGLRCGEVLAIRLEDIDGLILNVRHSWSDFDRLKSPKNGETRKVPLLPAVRDKLIALAKENPHGTDGFVFYGLLKDKPIDRSVLLDVLLLDGLKNACKAVGNNPLDWVIDPKKAEGDGSLWVTKGEKNARGELQGNWSNPEKVVTVNAPKSGLKCATEDFYAEYRYKRSLSKPESPVVINPTERGIVFHSHRHYYAARMADKMTAEQVSRITGHKSKAVFEEYADHIISENLEEAGAIGAEVFSNILQFKKGA
jgi:integrase